MDQYFMKNGKEDNSKDKQANKLESEKRLRNFERQLESLKNQNIYMQKDRMYGTLQLAAGTKGRVSAGVLEPSEARRYSPLRQKPQG